MADRNQDNVYICYHFFAHYRGAVIKELQRSDRYNYIFMGDNRDPFDGTVRPWTPPPEAQFVRCPCIRLFGLLFQPTLLQIVFVRDCAAVVLLGNMYMPVTWFVAAICRLRGTRVLFWTHGWRRPEKDLKGRIRCLFYSLAHGLLVYEHNAKCIAINEGFSAERVFVVYNSLDLDKQQSVIRKTTTEAIKRKRQALFARPELPIAMCCSRLVKTRRLHQLIEAMAQLKDQGIVVNLLIVGDGPERDHLETMSTILGVESHFYGESYDENELGTLFQAAAVVVSPGPIGLLVTHAFTYGRPVIANDNPLHQGPEWHTIIPGENGDLFVEDDTEDLAAKLFEWTVTSEPSAEVSIACKKVVKEAYNPRFQRYVIEQAIHGCDANDLHRVANRNRETRTSDLTK